MYRIVGADQKEYGPITAEQVRQWIKEGRANASTIARFEEGPWKPLSTFPEFASDLAQTGTPASSPPPFATGPLPSGLPGGPRNHPLAITGLVLSCLAIVPCCCFGPILSTVGIVLAAIALSQISQDPGKWTGKSLATAAIVIGLISFVFFGLFWVTKRHLILQKGPFRWR